MDASGQEGKCLDQPLDVRIGAAILFQLQARGGGRVLLGELLGELANEQQLALIVRIECFAHGALDVTE